MNYITLPKTTSPSPNQLEDTLNQIRTIIETLKDPDHSMKSSIQKPLLINLLQLLLSDGVLPDKYIKAKFYSIIDYLQIDLITFIISELSETIKHKNYSSTYLIQSFLCYYHY